MNDTMETLAVAAHGAMALAHGLGAVYNWRLAKRPDLHTWIHLLAAAYSAASVVNHMRRKAKEKS